MRGPSRFATLVAALPLVHAQLSTPSSWPQDYPGKPSGDFSPEWQKCTSHHFLTLTASPLKLHSTDFEVTEPLTNVTWTLPRNFAGNVGVNRAGHPNNTLFFWAFEKENGSLTAAAGDRADEPWGIWLNGGCGVFSHADIYTRA